jgi:hypothetical protein
MKALLIALLLATPSLAMAQDVGECDWRASAQNIAEPWETSTRSFANGEIRLTVMDAAEPAAGAFHLMILSPPYDEAGRQCRILSLQDGGMGFAGLTLDGAKADYDAATGLTLTMQASRWLPETDSYTEATLTVTVNQATGAISGTLD